jgi:hypothetical protein
MRMPFMQTLRRGLSPLLLAAALVACGPDLSQDGPVASDGSVEISPTTLDLDLSDSTGMATCTPGSSAAIFPVFVTTFDAKGFPVGNADITVQLDFSPSTTYVGTAAMALLDSSGTVLLTTLGGSPSYSTQTKDDGTAKFQLRADTSIACSYSGSLTVNSGSLINSMQVTASN